MVDEKFKSDNMGINPNKVNDNIRGVMVEKLNEAYEVFMASAENVNLQQMNDYLAQNFQHDRTLEINDIFEFVLYLSARLYNPECVTCYFIIMFAYFAKVKHDYFFIVKPVLHVLIILLVTLISKHIIGRPRPNVRENVKRNFILRHKEKNCSMPSGDAMQSANFAVILIYYFNCYYGILLIPFVMISRVYYFCHYVSDTVVGAIAGWIISYSLVVVLSDV